VFKAKDFEGKRELNRKTTVKISTKNNDNNNVRTCGEREGGREMGERENQKCYRL